MRIRRYAILVLALAVTVAACTRTVSESTPKEAADLPGLLVVSQDDASIFTINPDGSGRTTIVAQQPGLAAIQPTWSPDGTRVVWTEVNHMMEAPEASIVTSGVDGGELERVGISVPPFYYYWSPTGDQVAFLAGGPGGQVAFGMLEDGNSRFLGDARPFYFAWAPDGHALLTHTNLDAVALFTADGTATTLEKTEALFQAPQWAANGTWLVYATGAPPPTGGIRTRALQTNGQEIVITDTAGVIQHRVVGFTGVATFELSPNGRQIAHSATFDRDTFNFGPLVVTDLDSGAEQTVSQRPVVAYQWSPTGTALLYLVGEEGIDHPTFRWAVWDGVSTTEYSVVTPTTSFATSYLPFWDQYSRSHTMWAPDGSAFAYSGLNEAGEPAIWVQTIGEETEPSNIASGDVVFWSPTSG